MKYTELTAILDSARNASIEAQLAEAFAIGKAYDDKGKNSLVDGFTADELEKALTERYMLRNFASWKKARLDVARVWTPESDGLVPSLGAGVIARSFSNYVVVAQGVKTLAARVAWMADMEHKADFMSMAARELRGKYFSKGAKTADGDKADSVAESVAESEAAKPVVGLNMADVAIVAAALTGEALEAFERICAHASAEALKTAQAAHAKAVREAAEADAAERARAEAIARDEAVKAEAERAYAEAVAEAEKADVRAAEAAEAVKATEANGDVAAYKEADKAAKAAVAAAKFAHQRVNNLRTSAA